MKRRAPCSLLSLNPRYVSEKHRGKPRAMHHIPYIANILILLPVVYGMLRAPDGAPVAAFGDIADVPSLRIMVASLWAGVLMTSVIALFDPLQFWPLLVFQVLYKALFIAVFCLPVWRGTKVRVLPQGPVAVFVIIILVWPIFIVMALQSGQM